MQRSLLTALFGLALVFGPSVPFVLAADISVSSRTEFSQALRDARAGDRILVAAGEYAGGLSHTGLAGTKDQPVVIAAADSAHPPVIKGGSGGLHLSSPAHVVLRDLIIRDATGNGLNIDDGGSPGSAQDVVLQRIVVENIGPEGNRDGIKLSGVDRFRVEKCAVSRWGSGGSAIDMGGLPRCVITDCRFFDATGDAANGVQAKGGSHDIVIRRSRFENAGGRGVNVGGSTGLPFFRPADATFEARKITVEDCEFVGGQAAVAFVGVDGALVQHNTIYRPRRWAFRILQENTDQRFVPCRNGQVLNNVIVFRSGELSTSVNIGDKTAPETFQFSGNHWFCSDQPAQTKRLLRLSLSEANGSYGVDPQLADPEKGNLNIASGTVGVRSSD